MVKIVFSSSHLPPHLPTAARASAWLEQFEAAFGKVEINPMPDVPFNGHLEAVPLGEMSLATMAGSLASMKRSKKAIAADGQHATVLIINLAALPFQTVQRGRENTVAPGGAILFDEGSVGQFDTKDRASKTLSLLLPRAAFSAAVRNYEDLIAKPIAGGSEPLRMLRRYAEGVMAEGGPNDPMTARLVSSHLVDLAALTLGTDRETAEIAGQGGLRAGRLNAILATINAGFSDPSFSIHAVVQKERVSERYLRDLLHGSGTGFADRVLELRLQNAHRLLTHWQHSHRKVTDIALTSGFNDVSYFNRSFRRRFGMTPGDARSAATAVAVAASHR